MKSSNELKNLKKKIDQQIVGEEFLEEEINTVGKVIFEFMQLAREIEEPL